MPVQWAGACGGGGCSPVGGGTVGVADGGSGLPDDEGPPPCGGPPVERDGGDAVCPGGWTSGDRGAVAVYCAEPEPLGAAVPFPSGLLVDGDGLTLAAGALDGGLPVGVGVSAGGGVGAVVGAEDGGRSFPLSHGEAIRRIAAAAPAATTAPAVAMSWAGWVRQASRTMAVSVAMRAATPLPRKSARCRFRRAGCGPPGNGSAPPPLPLATWAACSCSWGTSRRACSMSSLLCSARMSRSCRLRLRLSRRKSSATAMKFATPSPAARTIQLILVPYTVGLGFRACRRMRGSHIVRIELTRVTLTRTGCDRNATT